MADEAEVKEEEVQVEHSLEELRQRNIARLQQFRQKARSRGAGYRCPNFPMFDANMEGLESGMFLVAGESNMGKALRLSTPVLLTSGKWTTIGDIKLGDKVWGDDGKPTTVVCKSKLFHDHKCYKVTFDDNTVLHADADHLWKVYKYSCHKPNNREMVIRTEDMFKDYKHVNPNGYARYNYRVPMQKPLEYPEKTLPIDPYVLGLWLGDGRADGSRMVCNDEEFPELKALLEERGMIVSEPIREKSEHGMIYNLGGEGKGHKNLFLEGLRELNLIRNKHIPAIYLHASIEQRMELLRGLMDTDGHCQGSKTGRGSCEFVQKKSSKINDTFGELLSSLGIKWTKREKEAICNGESFPAMRFRFAVDKKHSCFHLSSKHNNLRDELKDRTGMYKTIKEIVEIPTETMQCIEVNNASHCFCVGENLTVTHNTALASAISWSYMANEDNHLYLVFITLDDSADDVYPRIIAMNQDIPISVSSKPVMYEQRRDEGDAAVVQIDNWLQKGEAGLKQLEDLGEKFTLLDGSDITCGEDILEKCMDIKALVKEEDRRANLIVVIDSGMDIEWRDKHFKSDKELNDYTARQLKKWAVEILDCPVFVTLHLRKIEQNRRPTVADIKESGRWVYEASWLGLVHNDVSRNKQSATICLRDEQNNITPVIELNWAKNKKSSFKGNTYQTFVTNHSLVKECPESVATRFDHLIYSD